MSMTAPMVWTMVPWVCDMVVSCNKSLLVVLILSPGADRSR
jgi:hypothetical protein